MDGKASLEVEDGSVILGTSKEVVDELTLALVPLIPMIPNEKIYDWHEIVEDLYKKCVENKKLKVYIIFSSEFIHHPKFQSDSFVNIYVKNI